ncbi:DnaT-like ssDNA-binding protein [uncultured Brevundimonas sp.]|uniref:DnaT-like ssDNA-binding protein n=1 Tax=uncultured Brevundimonas sp. TaxID=213418 RepID=UPI002631E0AA|nr:DnaT-like ssDNA-binding protein [uncultured Brevundimonas sp.]
MALSVDPATADSFATLEEANAYAAAQGLTAWATAPDSPPDAKEAALRRATSHLSGAYNWIGKRTGGRDQTQAWPRTGVTDREGEPIADDEIPVEVKHACIIIAAQELEQPGSMDPQMIPAQRVKQETVGPISVTYADGGNDPADVRPVLLKVKDLLAGLYHPDNAGTALFGSSMRS